MPKPSRPSRAPDDLKKAVALHQQGSLAEAEQIYKDILKTDPRHFDASHLLGVVFVQQGEPELAEEQLRRALEINPKSAAACSNLGNALCDLNRPQEALESFDRAIALQKDFADAHLNRANALHVLKRKEEALAAYDRAILLNPKSAEASYGRSKVLRELGRLEEAVAGFGRALALKPGYSSAHKGRAQALAGLGRPGEALADIERVVAQRPDDSDALVRQGHILSALGRFDDALRSFTAAAALKPEYPAVYGFIGDVYRARGDTQGAIPFYEKNFKLDSKAHGLLYVLAESYFELGDLLKAFAYSTRAIEAGPENILYKERFIFYARDAALSAYLPNLERALLECLKTPGLDCAALQGLWYSLFTLNPANAGIYRLQGGEFDAAHFDKAQDVTPLLKPFFLKGLEKICIYKKPFEDFAVRLRRALLLQPKRFTEEARLALAAALSHYALNAEYIFDVTPEEQAAVKKLGFHRLAVALRACYAPLIRLGEADAVAAKFAGDADLGGVIAAQITDERRLRAQRKAITALTPISAGVSAKVREQYEESPYPRWKYAQHNLVLDPCADSLKKPGTRILVAGCGTGQEAVEMAIALPGADILAVDLSLSSLSYAKMKAEEHGLKNLVFRQADILLLGTSRKRFDAITSGGVLHHLHDPMQGWRVLAGLLKPQGLMRVALYSKTARRRIAVAQEAVKKSGHPVTAEGMRAFRKESRAKLDAETLAAISGVSDYYHLSMYRDLLFHVQEHCFDIPQLEKAFAALQLEFLKFLQPAAVMKRYHKDFPQDGAAVSLKNWHAFELRNPDTFIAMYQFWCRKP